ncbi:unnamed protein product [Adineta steineri]|uniref:VCBS repeat-containing protein n=1 Tax=Adineta steineri TaxID=433720 RepID=A0A819KCV9_9BILA|nr:unnamed protein product [Adineta steineri]
MFASQVLYTAGPVSKPAYVAVGDFNGDGKIDIVTANSGTNNIGIFLNNGAGTFATQVTYPTGSSSHPYGVAVGDFNGDGKIDIVSATQVTNNIGIFLNNGAGTFATQVTYPTGSSSHPYGVAVGDFNGDGKIDIVTANSGNGHIGIFLNNGAGTFATQVTYPTGSASQPFYVAVGDFNGDGKIDIVSATQGTNNMGVFINNGAGTFATQITYPTGSSSAPDGIAVSDFNGDGQIDIVTSNYGTNNMGIFLNNGAGTFATQITYPTGSGSGPSVGAVGDFNGDGQIDIVSSNYGLNNIGIFLNIGAGTFATQVTFTTGSGSTPNCVAVGDFNGDGKNDVVSANQGTNNIGIFLQM